MNSIERGPTPSHLLSTAAEEFGTRPAFRFENRLVTYDELDQRASGVSEFASELSGTRISLSGERSRWDEFLIGYVGLQRAGCVPVVLPSEARLVESFSGPPAPARLISVSPPQIAREERSPTFHLVQTGEHPAHPQDVVYTSGSTGIPKAISTNVQEHLVGMKGLPRGWYGKCLVNAFPPTTSFGIHGSMFFQLLGGFTVHVVEHLTAQSFARAAEQDVICALLPAPFGSLLARTKHPIRHGSLRAVIVAGAPSKSDDLARLSRRLGCAVLNMYGTSEAGSAQLLTLGRRGTAESVIGRRQRGTSTEFRILDMSGNECPPLEVGEISLRAIATPGSGKATWFRTGDLGWVDLEGTLYLSQRGDLSATTGGKTVSLERIEAAFGSIRGVRSVAAFAIPHPHLGTEVGLAMVTARDFIPSGLCGMVREFISTDELPRRLYVMDRLPTSDSGKVSRGTLIASALAGELKEIPARDWRW